MKRILVLSELNANKYGSIEEFEVFLAKELVRRGCQCYLGFIAEPDPAVKKKMEEAGAVIATIFHGDAIGAKGKRDSIIARMAALYRFIRNAHIDIVHINFYSLTNPCLLGVYLSGVRIIFTEHASGSAPVRGVFRHLVSGVQHFFLTRRTARYVAVSDFVRNRLKVSHHAGPDRTITIYNSVNLERFAPRDQAKARSMMGLPHHARIVVTVAMLIPEKGIHHLIEAAAILVREFGTDDLCIVIVGVGHYRESLEKMAGELGVGGHVRFLGLRSDVDLIIAAADVVAVPSVWAEAFGLIIAEGMAAGRPVIASLVGGIPELIEDRQTGLLVDPGDSRGLAAGIHELLMEPELASFLAKNALEKARRKFNVEIQAACYADLFDEVLYVH